ncbi:MAG: zinc ribbon domain-containing protein [Myxococcota bacterium]|nr:zinc ribbon domain-containing protein [Myxococcota bacterium]
MPVYEYACKGCGHEFEREQRITDKPIKKCPECGALKAKRLISRTSFVLKGGGWYSDLYASPKAAGSKDEGKGEAKAEGKSEGKDAGSGKGDAAGGKDASTKSAKGAKGSKASKAAD